MAKIIAKPTIEMTIIFELTEEEAFALNALAEYGTNAFLHVFYEEMGRAYLEPHEEGLRSLFISVQGAMPQYKQKIADARKVFES